MSNKKYGFDSLNKELNKIQKNGRELDGENNVPLNELFESNFMTTFTHFNNFDEMLRRSQFNINSLEDFEAIPSSEWETFIKEKTSFINWDEMYSKAVEIWTLKSLGLM
ncbi:MULTISPECIES: hypothetical protein [Pontibacillus]|uniref:Uncharacterized protein n=1 Tax=Pontibacillus chungwhensis TaxID=265426 RepID=A0ABY8V3S2_9BACI|nr:MULTISPECIES: hypothetical protein [Pontibacillus]MCD5322200.1 hypothetical protein [Pontibacillus sp. HN14]WIF99494.1 hypothetical protein QNI29_07505 [Pontibacillus chungwhensis]